MASVYLSRAHAEELSGVCVKVAHANLRAGPDAKYDKTWEVFRHFAFKEVKREGTWVQVKDLDGDEHWVSAALLTDKIKCGVVTQDNINLRTKPDAKSDVIKKRPKAKRYEGVKILKEKGTWLHVEDFNGLKSWISSEFVWRP